MKTKIAIVSGFLLLATAAWAQITIDPVVADVKATISPTGDKNETRVAKEVRHELLMLPHYTLFDDLGFTVTGNNVELTGAVVNGDLIKEAEKAVKHIEGVGTVTNHITMLPSLPQDRRIREATARKMFDTPGLSAYSWQAAPSIHIIVLDGRTRLIGYVNNQGDKEMATTIAQQIPDVFGVKNDLQVVSDRK
jgi:osmotically-inducible protein OsmY